MVISSEKRKIGKRSQRKRITFLFVLGVILASVAIMLLIPGVGADDSVVSNQLGIQIPGSGVVTNFYEYISALVSFCTIVLGPLVATAMIMYGGYRIIYSQGDTKALTDGKDIIVGALFGYALLLFTKLIMNLLGT